MMSTCPQVTGGTPDSIDWASLQLPQWITDRLERLGYPYPTEVCVPGFWLGALAFTHFQLR